MKLYFESFKMHFKSALQYKESLILGLISQILVFFTYYFIILALFGRFNNIRGFTLYEVLLCFSIIQFGFSFNELFFRGVDVFEELIINGMFDILLLRPQNIMLQVFCSNISFVKASRLIQSLIIFVIAIVNLNLDFTLLKVLVLLLMFISSIIVFLSVFILMASYCFTTVQGLEIKNLFTDGGKHSAQYPIGIFNKGIRALFTFVIPYAFVNYYPLLYVLGKSNNILYAFSPLLVFFYLIPALLLFKLGMKKYTSTGS